MREVRGAIRTFVRVDVVIADAAELEADRDAPTLRHSGHRDTQ